jgi:F-type H+-transporting ATPase subunit O
LDDVLKAKKYSDLTANFFGVLADNNRLVRAPGVIKAFGTLMSAHRGEITCVVTTAKTLASKDIKDLEGVLNGFLEKGQKLNVNYQIDPSLIGGMIVDIGDKYIDMSTATKINKIIKSIEEGL